MNLGNLYIFTEYYPYGSGETFIEEEIKYLIKSFPRLVFVPRLKSKKQRKLKIEAQVDERLLTFSFFEAFKILIKNFCFIGYYKTFYQAVKRNKFRSVFRSWRYFLGQCIYGKFIADKIYDIDVSGNYLYSYWFKHSALGIAWSQGNATKIVRGHGSDIYELNYVHSFHDIIAGIVNKILVVSKYGKEYLNKRYNISLSKILVSRLGTTRKFGATPILHGNKFHIVSCSNCTPLKRVECILESCISLAEINSDESYIYTHFGDGPTFIYLQELSKRGPKNLEIRLFGRIKNDFIQTYYANNFISCFVNYSTTEGIPVSIMEAISYGIPVVAPAVGGIQEIVNSKNGILLGSNASVEDLLSAIKYIVFNRNTYNSLEIIDFWKSNYNAEIQVKKVATLLMNS